ncbi:hypothetical protein SFA35_06035 [Pseudomonas sp. HR96]|uniref:hypothetical protein n=1 Tax=Pseudomonas sp. HR96 TaxID=1027966 RepID=UPI002A754183|nr:hypothetical protein [Pseudomonas sp. HR96]WPP00926.1 hypothetical protein SFA35_06035 [Pseudomonas sp. HR96]
MAELDAFRERCRSARLSYLYAHARVADMSLARHTQGALWNARVRELDRCLALWARLPHLYPTMIGVAACAPE